MYKNRQNQHFSPGINAVLQVQTLFQKKSGAQEKGWARLSSLFHFFPLHKNSPIQK